MFGVDSGDGRCRHAEVQMIANRVGIAGLGVGAAAWKQAIDKHKKSG